MQQVSGSVLRPSEASAFVNSVDSVDLRAGGRGYSRRRRRLGSESIGNGERANQPAPSAGRAVLRAPEEEGELRS